MHRASTLICTFVKFVKKSVLICTEIHACLQNSWDKLNGTVLCSSTELRKIICYTRLLEVIWPNPPLTAGPAPRGPWGCSELYMVWSLQGSTPIADLRAFLKVLRKLLHGIFCGQYVLEMALFPSTPRLRGWQLLNAFAFCFSQRRNSLKANIRKTIQ